MTFGQRFKELRIKNNFTQDELAKILNYGRTAISNYENGKSTPSFDDLIIISSVFDVSVDYLLGKTNDPVLPNVIELKPDPATDFRGFLEYGLRKRGQLGKDEHLTDERYEILLKTIDGMMDVWGKK